MKNLLKIWVLGVLVASFASSQTVTLMSDTAGAS